MHVVNGNVDDVFWSALSLFFCIVCCVAVDSLQLAVGCGCSGFCRCDICKLFCVVLSCCSGWDKYL